MNVPYANATSGGKARDEITAGGSGSPSVGMIYALRKNDGITHDSYFAALNAWLEEERARRSTPGKEAD